MFYHGTKSKKDFRLQRTFERYNYPYLFGASEKNLALQYAKHYGGTPEDIITFRVKTPLKTLDFNAGFTYSATFHNLINNLSKKHPAVLIQNCMDRPNALFDYALSDIVVVFDFGCVEIIEGS